MGKEISYGIDFVGRFRLFNFATGSYTCKCLICGIEFIGDKKALTCLKCAIDQANVANEIALKAVPKPKITPGEIGFMLGVLKVVHSPFIPDDVCIIGDKAFEKIRSATDIVQQAAADKLCEECGWFDGKCCGDPSDQTCLGSLWKPRTTSGEPAGAN